MAERLRRTDEEIEEMARHYKAICEVTRNLMAPIFQPTAPPSQISSLQPASPAHPFSSQGRDADSGCNGIESPVCLPAQGGCTPKTLPLGSAEGSCLESPCKPGDQSGPSTPSPSGSPPPSLSQETGMAPVAFAPGLAASPTPPATFACPHCGHAVVIGQP